MAWVKAIAAAIRTDMGSTVARPRHALLIALGFLVAGTTVALLLTVPAGVRQVAGKTGSPDIAMVLPDGASTESSGNFSTTTVPVIETLPGVARAAGGQALVAPQFVVNTRLVRPDGSTATVLVRGVTPLFWNVVGKSVELVSGSRFQTGKDQLIAGAAVARGFVSLRTGDVVRLRNERWLVAGHFSAGGGFWESQLWTGMATLQSTYHAQGRVSVAWVRLSSPAAFAAFSHALHDNPRTQGLYAETQRAYYSSQTAFLRSFIQIATVATGIALGLGSIFAIVNALAMALEARRHDLAVLRAVGFQRGTLAVALLIDVLLIAVVCAGIALLISWFAVNGREIGSSTVNTAIQFKLRVDGSVVGWTVAYLVVIGGLSAVWPITHAVRATLTKALQDE